MGIGEADSKVGRRREPVQLTAGRLVGGGAALAHHEGRTWMVRGALPDETVEVQATHERAGVVHGRVVALAGPAHPARLTDPCPHAAACGGCDWPHVEPAAGAALKAQVAAGAARAYPILSERLAAVPVAPSPLSYRLRCRLHWDPVRRVLGFYAPRSWSVTDIPSCRVISPRLAGALSGLGAALERSCPAPVDIEWLEDLEGGAAVAGLRSSRTGPRSVDPSWVPDREAFDLPFDGFHVLDRSGNARPGWGCSHVVMNLPPPLEVPIGAFFQGNRHLVRWLFSRVRQLARISHRRVKRSAGAAGVGGVFDPTDAQSGSAARRDIARRPSGRPRRRREAPKGPAWAGAHGGEKTPPAPVHRALQPRDGEKCGLACPDSTPAWDLHGGVGFLAAAVGAAERRGITVIERFRPAARAARRNLPEASAVVCQTAEAYLAQHTALPREALAITDPPRAGLSPRLRRQLAGWHPQRILMLSCDPATWARDTAFLLEHGYVLGHLELLDLYPSTHHAEVLAMLESEG